MLLLLLLSPDAKVFKLCGQPTIVVKEIIFQLPFSSPLLVGLGEVQEKLLEVENPALRFTLDGETFLTPARFLLKLEKTESWVPDMMEIHGNNAQFRCSKGAKEPWISWSGRVPRCHCWSHQSQRRTEHYVVLLDFPPKTPRIRKDCKATQIKSSPRNQSETITVLMPIELDKRESFE